MKIRNYVFKIVQDHTPESPRYHDNLGLMICAHRSLSLGDEQSTDPIDLCAYATKKENFLGWVFDAFIHSHETCPELLKEWYLWDDNMGQVFFCKNDDKNDTGNHCLDDFLPKSFIKAIEDWMEDNLAILPLYLYEHRRLWVFLGLWTGWLHLRDEGGLHLRDEGGLRERLG